MTKTIELDEEEIKIIQISFALLYKELMPTIYENCNPIKFENIEDMKRYLAVLKDLDIVSRIGDKLKNNESEI